MSGSGRSRRLGLARAIVEAAAFSGVPSTACTLAAGGDILAASRAAGALLGKPTVPRGLAAHAVLSAGWGCVLGRVLPARHRVLLGALAGAAIHVLDMRVIGRRIPALAALPEAPQLADHLAFGAIIGWRTRTPHLVPRQTRRSR